MLRAKRVVDLSDIAIPLQLPDLVIGVEALTFKELPIGDSLESSISSKVAL